MTELKDSGARRDFGTGAVRDVAEGKGRCDLLPFSIIASVQGKKDMFLYNIGEYIKNGDPLWLKLARDFLIEELWAGDYATAMLELAQHYEDGAQKYGDNNWKHGIPMHCYIDSATRHYLKFRRGDNDEPHNRACLWNICCGMWTIENYPNLIDIEFEDMITGNIIFNPKGGATCMTAE